MARDVQERDLVEQLLSVQRLTIRVMSGDEDAQQVVGGMPPLPRDDLIGDVAADRLVGVDRSLQLTLPSRQGGLRHRLRPGADLFTLIGVGHAEDVGDHLEREGEGERSDHVDRLARVEGLLLHLVEHDGDVLDDRRSQRLHLPRREDLGHDPSDSRVSGRIEVDQAVGEDSGTSAERTVRVRDVGVGHRQALLPKQP